MEIVQLANENALATKKGEIVASARTLANKVVNDLKTTIFSGSDGRGDASDVIPVVSSLCLVNAVAMASLKPRKVRKSTFESSGRHLFDLNGVATNQSVQRMGSKLLINLKNPQATAVMYATGAVWLTTCDSEYDMAIVLMYIQKLMQNSGQDCTASPIKITNFVFTSDLGYKIDLRRLSEEVGSASMYKPGVFAGYSYSLSGSRSNNSNNVSAIIFENGHFSLVGCVSREEAYEYACVVTGKTALCKKKADPTPVSTGKDAHASKQTPMDNISSFASTFKKSLKRPIEKISEDAAQ